MSGFKVGDKIISNATKRRGIILDYVRLIGLKNEPAFSIRFDDGESCICLGWAITHARYGEIDGECKTCKGTGEILMFNSYVLCDCKK